MCCCDCPATPGTFQRTSDLTTVSYKPGLHTILSTTSKVYPAKTEEKSKLPLKNLNVAWMCRSTSNAILKWMQDHECKESEDRGMQEVTFEVETITPLFLAGADQATAELRAPSFRGEMRYWLRALVGGMMGTGPDGLKMVKNAENEVFGAT